MKYIGENVFVNTPSDERLGPSSDDKEFAEMMSKEMVKDAAGNWCSPLPFIAVLPLMRLHDLKRE